MLDLTVRQRLRVTLTGNADIGLLVQELRTKESSNDLSDSISAPIGKIKTKKMPSANGVTVSSVVDLFDRQVEAAPDSPAVQVYQSTSTYSFIQVQASPSPSQPLSHRPSSLMTSSPFAWILRLSSSQRSSPSCGWAAHISSLTSTSPSNGIVW